MKRIAIFLVAVTLRAATYYVGTAGSDSNTPSQAQSIDTPWLTIQHSVNNMACGDTLMVIANGSYLQGADANFPYFPDCVATTTIQSSALGMFAPAGYRTNPANDSPNYGKLQFNSPGWNLVTFTHGGWLLNAYGQTYGTSPECNFAKITPTDGSAATVFTIGHCLGGLLNLANGSQVELEVNAWDDPSSTLAKSLPVGFTKYQVYYVVNCSTNPVCNQGSVGGGSNVGAGTYFSLAATPGGTPIKATACVATPVPGPACYVDSVIMGQPLNVDVAGSTFTIPDTFTACGAGPLNICFANGAAVTFASVGLFGYPSPSVPAPLQANTPYYVTGLGGSCTPTGRCFQVSDSPGGSAITLSAIGAGPLTVTLVQSPSQWAFRGLEFYYTGAATIYGFMTLGFGGENSSISKVHNVEVDRCYLHDNPSDPQGAFRGIMENGRYINIHDSFISGNRAGESQAIMGAAAPGPTAITNNFLEASGENTLLGGALPVDGGPNANHTYVGNYYYKPPAWKRTTNTGTPSGACWWDNADLAWAGGEWFYDGTNWWNCTSSHTWSNVGASGPVFNNPTTKNMAESKSCTYCTWTGNLFSYAWGAAQGGVIFNVSQEPGSGAGIANDNLILQNNKMLHALQFWANLQYCDAIPGQPCPIPATNHTYKNNLFVPDLEACGVQFTTGTNTCVYQMDLTQFSSISGMTVDHNTIPLGDTWSGLTNNANPPVASYVGGNPACYTGKFFMDHFVFQNNIIGGEWRGDCVLPSQIIPIVFTNSIWQNSVLLNANGLGSGYTAPGTGNTFARVQFPTSNTTIGYVNQSAGDYHLASTSHYSAANPAATLLSPDGTDLGADIDLLNMATSGAAAGTPTWDQQAGLRVVPGSTQVVFHYTAPTPDACAATIYGAAARVPANQVASVSDNSVDSISNANTREIYIHSLRQLTHYWYKLACGGGVLMVGEFWTRGLGQGTSSFTFDWGTPTAMQYSSSPSMSDPVSLPAATRQFIPVPANSVVYVQIGPAGPITMVIAP